jgi:hypothetical protein
MERKKELTNKMQELIEEEKKVSGMIAVLSP